MWSRHPDLKNLNLNIFQNVIAIKLISVYWAKLYYTCLKISLFLAFDNIAILCFGRASARSLDDVNNKERHTNLYGILLPPENCEL